MALLGLDGVWHVPRDRSEDATTSICGLRFIGEFDGRDDAELPLGEWCPDCAEQDVDLAEPAVPAPLVEAAVIAVDAYQRDAELAGASFVEIQNTMLFATVGQKPASVR